MLKLYLKLFELLFPCSPPPLTNIFFTYFSTVLKCIQHKYNNYKVRKDSASEVLNNSEYYINFSKIYHGYEKKNQTMLNESQICVEGEKTFYPYRLVGYFIVLTSVGVLFKIKSNKIKSF